ncbi:hypothetical protein BU16DRAFT_521699 [Lophium mytilinum]|uniref:Secreted protein n=1 Tax=Lophium mytilinum TaxID=390894 RepID=A0A6A6RE89_9PEZI|nr:hypothetical protein BU16DRAFT_521699 [Lophium mytilinum]
MILHAALLRTLVRSLAAGPPLCRHGIRTPETVPLSASSKTPISSILCRTTPTTASVNNPYLPPQQQ